MKVIAVETGYDGHSVRNPGDTFEMPDDVFDQRPKLNEDGVPIKDQFYEPPAWFEPVDASAREKVEADRKAIRKQGRIPLKGSVPAIDPARQQADATAEGRMRAAAEAAVRAELAAVDEAEVSRRVEKKLAELRSSAGLKAPADEGAKPKAAATPSPDNLPRDSTKKP